MRRFHSDENWELSIGQIRSDLTNAQFPILNSHPNGKLTQIRPLGEQYWGYVPISTF